MIIEKKTWPEYFEKILSGDKTFELRLADWECNIGDTLVLKEWDPKTKSYTGRKVEKIVTYVAKTKDADKWNMFSKEDIEKFGFQIISFK
jgi:ASC-1-like (ASCH) protein